MKFKALIIVIISVFFVQILGCVVFFLGGEQLEQDTTRVNNTLQNVKKHWGNLGELPQSEGLHFSILDSDGNLLHENKEGLASSINEAIKNRDTILDVEVDGEVVGKLIVASGYEIALAARDSQFLIFNMVMLGLLLATLVGYITYVNVRIIRPFNALSGFATSISNGNLEHRLNMDKGNIFGAFTESFDIMRMEIKKAKEAEQKANESKKQLIANLSHDIKTPIASIKAIAELGEFKAPVTSKEGFSAIIKKADQVNVLVSNLFSATLEELSQLSISVSDHESGVLCDMLRSADYLEKAEICKIPEMLLSFDSGRLQQVFDNIISNSYKYASTPIEIKFKVCGSFLNVAIKDYGGFPEDFSKLSNKFYRGKNAVGKDGAGLGLFISNYLMNAMNGRLELDCGNDYFLAKISIKIS